MTHLELVSVFSGGMSYPHFIFLHGMARVDFSGTRWLDHGCRFMSSGVPREFEGFLWDPMAFTWHISSSA